MTSPSKRRRRRTFLKQIPTTIAAGLAAPSVLSAEPAVAQTPAAGAAGQGNNALTIEMLASTQKVAAVSLPSTELEAALPLVSRNLANIASVRDVKLTPDVEPAFSYRPPRPKQPSRVIA